METIWKGIRCSNYAAMTLNNLGNSQSDKNEFEVALGVIQEALEIYRKLAQANHQTYLPDVAMTLNNLGICNPVRTNLRAPWSRTNL